MDKKTSGIASGIVCLVGFLVFLVLALNNEWNASGQLLWASTPVLLGLSIGCFWKPESVGQALWNLLEKLNGNGQRTDSHDVQVQDKSSGNQAMAGDGAQINQYNITIAPKSEKKTENDVEKEGVGNLKKNSIINEKLKSVFLPDITDLNIDNHLLDQLYGQAFNQATILFYDAKLTTISIQVSPFKEPTERVSIFLYFYSKSANKIVKFQYSEKERQLKILEPHRFAHSDMDKMVSDNLPWQEAPEWQTAIIRSYAKISPLTPVNSSYYYIAAYGFLKPLWKITFDDGFNGVERCLTWDPRKGLSADSISLEL